MRLEPAAARVPSFLREEAMVFGLDGLALDDAVATILDEGFARLGAAALPCGDVAELLASFTPLVDGVALLHAPAPIDDPVVLIGASRAGIEWDGGSKLHLLFVISKPHAEEPQVHLDRLAAIARIAGSPGLLDRTAAADSSGELLAALAPTGAGGS
jgi:hypothetical protein